MSVLRLLPLIAIACAGCALTPPPPSRAELREYDRLRVNEARASRLLSSGAIYAGQDVYDFLKLCEPYRVDFVGRYAFVEFHPVPNTRGLTLIAVDNKLVSARRWSCTRCDVLFETIGEDERRAAYAAYEPRVFGHPR